ncbi:hypothetical protein Y032_0086g1989 [Ancylostoma ceylanicum]|uniref:Large ribosomal subunit protein bL9m n=2 Tax=Ancylostoma ceylanicum TaxID=53326 RepID=A0A016TQ60_9BILA|nr:hypothetical protein Y032_0086g1989 [Ancylostoma ceylanicum]
MSFKRSSMLKRTAQCKILPLIKSGAMIGSTAATFRVLPGAAKCLQPARNTWILRRVYAPEPTPPGKVQRSPEELPNLMKLETVEYETLKPAGPLKVILLQDIEGVGHQFDVVDVDRRLARSNLLPTRKAVYASPFDLEYYAKVKERMADELAKRVRIPYEYVCIGRDLQALVVPIKVSMENKWTIDKNIIKTSLRQAGIDMLDDAIFLNDEVISGPNFEIEARLIRFYVVVCFLAVFYPISLCRLKGSTRADECSAVGCTCVPPQNSVNGTHCTRPLRQTTHRDSVNWRIGPLNGRRGRDIDPFSLQVSKQYIVPMLGKITHISVDESKQMLTPESSRAPTAAQLARFGIKEEQPHYSATPEIDASFPVVDFMKRKVR